MIFSKKLCFNSSLPRSGSTLLQNILSQNPRFYSSATSGLIDLLFSSRAYFSQGVEFKAQDGGLMREAFRGYCEFAIHGYYEYITDRPVCVDKSRSWFHYYDWLKTFQPEPKIIVCIRDLRAILSSMEKLYRKNRHLQDRSEDVLKMNMLTVDNRILHWLNSAPVGIAHARLIDAIQLGHHKRFCFVRFEDLTTTPEAVMRKVYDYLGEEYFSHDFENVEQATFENDQLHGIYGDHQIRGKVAPVAPDYHEVLGREVSNSIKTDNPLFYSTFYPEK
jgi:sulfotransferase